MKEINVTGQKREALGKKASKTLRKEGLVPCNLYGLAEQDGKPVAKSFAIAMTELRKIIYTPHISTSPASHTQLSSRRFSSTR